MGRIWQMGPMKGFGVVEEVVCLVDEAKGEIRDNVVGAGFDEGLNIGVGLKFEIPNFQKRELFLRLA